MAWMGKAPAAAVWLAAACVSAIATPAHEAITQGQQEFLAQLSGEALEIADRVKRTGEHEARPFAVVDKRRARIFVFDSEGGLRGASPVLLGQAGGDEITQGVGEHAQ